MMGTYIISQVLITCALLLQGGTYFITNRHQQLIAIILSNLLSASCFFILGGYVAVVMNVIAIARDVTSNIIYSQRGAQQNSDKITTMDCWLLMLWISLLTIGNLFTAHGVLSMLPYFSTMIFTVAIWQKSILVYRFAGLLTNSLLIAYNLFMHNFMGVILQSVLLMFAIIGFSIYLSEHQHTQVAHK